MNVQMIEVDRAEAREKYEHYRGQLKKRHDETDAALAKAFKAASQGLRILDVYQTIEDQGFDDKGRPMLAIARAGMDFVHYRRRGGWESPTYVTGADGRNSSAFSGGWLSRRSEGRASNPYWTVKLPSSSELPHCDESRAQIPIVPPEFRPKYKLTNYHILFEAEWKKVPPTDPILLKHLGGPLYVVLAEWDLTEIERAVMRQAFTR